MSEHKSQFEEFEQDLRLSAERLSRTRFIVPDPRLLENVISHLTKTAPSGEVGVKKHSQVIPSPYASQPSLITQMMSWKVLVPSALVLLFVASIGIDLAERVVPIEESIEDAELIIQSAPSADTGPSMMLASEPAPEAGGAARTMTMDAKIAAPTPTVFEANVSRGEFFQKDIGQGLLFQLTPNEHGWYADIVPKTAGNGYGFASVATPPLHGINPLQIEGWHFRNLKNTAANDGSVNAPGNIREFIFVSQESDAAALAGVSQKISSQGVWEYPPDVQRGNGTLEIRDLTLGNLLPGSRAWIESMKLQITLYPPQF